MIEVVPYDTKWPEMFASEAKLVKKALGDNCITIHHIGSTAVPGLHAKPIIDMIPVVQDIQLVDQATESMVALGYEAKGEFGIAFRRYFQKGKIVRTHNVHVFEEGDLEITRHLKFRDWMRTHPEDAAAYAQLKEKLATTAGDMLEYCNGKDAFVAAIDAKSGYDGWRMVQALTDREWSFVHKFQPKPGPRHTHFVFYKNSEIIGYAQLEHAVICMIVIDEPYRNLFLKQCERWLHHQDFK